MNFKTTLQGILEANETYVKERSDAWDSRRWAKIAPIFADLADQGMDIRQASQIWGKLKDADYILYMGQESIGMIESLIEKALSANGEKEMRHLKQVLEANPTNANIELRALLSAMVKEIDELKQLRDDLRAYKENAKITPYPGGSNLRRAPIFTNLIGGLGTMLNPFFYPQSYQTIRTPRLVLQGAKIIAKLLNSFFMNFELNFTSEIVRKRYDSYLEKK